MFDNASRNTEAYGTALARAKPTLLMVFGDWWCIGANTVGLGADMWEAHSDWISSIRFERSLAAAVIANGK